MLPTRGKRAIIEGRTLAVEERELDDALRVHAWNGRLDVVEARVLEGRRLGLVRRVADEVLGDERLADDVPPVPRRAREDRAQRGRRALVLPRVDVGEDNTPA